MGNGAGGWDRRAAAAEGNGMAARPLCFVKSAGWLSAGAGGCDTGIHGISQRPGPTGKGGHPPGRPPFLAFPGAV